MNYPNAPRFDSHPALLRPFNGKILEIVYPNGNNLGVRKIVSRSRSRPTGKYPSWKMQRVLEWESHNELHAFRLLDVNPKVKEFYGQPVAVHFEIDGERHWHVPDILSITNNGKDLWEVKPERFAASHRIAKRTAFLSWALRREGYRYSLVISEKLGRQPRLMNASTILRHGRDPVAPHIREQLRLNFLDEPRITWGELVSRDKPFLAAICRLILEGQIGIDMDTAISPVAFLWWNPDNSLHGGV